LGAKKNFACCPDIINLADWQEVVKKTKERKSPSPSRMHYGMFKVISNTKLEESIVHLIKLCFRHQHALKRWHNITCIMLKKGKGSRIDKLRIIQLIECDLQLVLKVVFQKQLMPKAENMGRLTYTQHGSRAGKDIATTQFEKRLLCDYSRLLRVPMVYIFVDGVLCYYKIVAAMGLLISYGIEPSYGNTPDIPLFGTGQENISSVIIWVLTSCVILWILRDNKGVEIKDLF